MDLLPVAFGSILILKLQRKNLAYFQMSPGTPDKKQNSNKQESTIKSLLDYGASKSIVYRDILHERHKIIEQKKNWSSIAGTLDKTSAKDLKYKFLDLYHATGIITKFHFIDQF